MIELDTFPDLLEGHLIIGVGRIWTATEGTGNAWPASTRLRVEDHAGVEQVLTPVIVGTLATWTLTVAEALALRGTKTSGSLHARITTGTGDALRPWAAGRISIVSAYVGSGAAQSLGTVTLGPAGQSAFEVAQFHGFEGTEAEWLDTLTGFRAIADPDNPDLIIITYPTWALDADLTSILIPILEA